jgi:hypothetical protein
MSDKYQKKIDTSKVSQAEDAGLLYKGVIPSTVESLTSNFLFLKHHDPVFFQLASAAEQYFRLDPNTTMVKLRQLTEAMAKDIASRLNISPYAYKNQHDLIYQIDRRINLDSRIKDIFYKLTKDVIYSISFLLRTEGSYIYERIGN